jgi:uncharacterized membrane protein
MDSIASRTVLLVFTAVILAGGVSATTITSEEVTIDLEDSKVSAEVEVEELTSSNFIYTTNTDVSDLNASMDGRELECLTEDTPLGSQVECEVDRERNFTVSMEFRSEDLVTDQGATKVFNFQQLVLRPTESYSLEVVLPRGAALEDRENSTQQVISPLDYETMSNGRRISVQWDMQPQLGETLSFYILYHDFNTAPPDSGSEAAVLKVLGILAGLVTAIAAIFVLHRRMSREEISSIYSDLSEDEKEVIDLIRENDGEYLQKDLVDDLDYSKAKISDIVSGLVESEVIEKSKEGRSNKLSISKKYSL